MAPTLSRGRAPPPNRNTPSTGQPSPVITVASCPLLGVLRFSSGGRDGREAEVRLDLLDLREARAGVLGGHGRSDDDAVADVPVGRGRERAGVGDLEPVECPTRGRRRSGGGPGHDESARGIVTTRRRTAYISVAATGGGSPATRPGVEQPDARRAAGCCRPSPWRRRASPPVAMATIARAVASTPVARTAARSASTSMSRCTSRSAASQRRKRGTASCTTVKNSMTRSWRAAQVGALVGQHRRELVGGRAGRGCPGSARRGGVRPGRSRQSGSCARGRACARSVALTPGCRAGRRARGGDGGWPAAQVAPTRSPTAAAARRRAR